ncbi:hypothetical protein ABFG93_04855 [Pseudalkalibacillus hwajinpoensis]|uniref:SunI/YnzG family protein n=1 Tax=Guptibacillus hwajinpoensis TaxID=208199 RepID=UPI00325A5871
MLKLFGILVVTAALSYLLHLLTVRPKVNSSQITINYLLSDFEILKQDIIEISTYDKRIHGYEKLIGTTSIKAESIIIQTVSQNILLRLPNEQLFMKELALYDYPIHY